MDPEAQADFVAEHADALRDIAKEVVARRILFKTHLWLYIIANTLVFLLYFVLREEGAWFLWVLVPWGAAVLLHEFNFYIFRHGFLSSFNQYAFVYHTLIFILGNLLLIFIDGFTSLPSWSLEWYWIAMLGWLIGYGVHLIIFLLVRVKEQK